jgi:hypothetical protein
VRSSGDAIAGSAIETPGHKGAHKIIGAEKYLPVGSTNKRAKSADPNGPGIISKIQRN